LEVLEAELTLNQIASKYELLPANVKNWKKMFLENMSLAFDKSTVVKEYKEKIEVLQSSNDSYTTPRKRNNNFEILILNKLK